MVRRNKGLSFVKAFGKKAQRNKTFTFYCLECYRPLLTSYHLEKGYFVICMLYKWDVFMKHNVLPIYITHCKSMECFFCTPDIFSLSICTTTAIFITKDCSSHQKLEPVCCKKRQKKSEPRSWFVQNGTSRGSD